MKKQYLIFFMSLILIIAYFDLIDSCSKMDKVISSMIKLDSEIKTEIDTSTKYTIKLVKD